MRFSINFRVRFHHDVNIVNLYYCMCTDRIDVRELSCRESLVRSVGANPLLWIVDSFVAVLIIEIVHHFV